MEPIILTAVGITASKLKSCLNLCKKIYNSARTAKHNEDKCFEVAQRCKLLENNINQIKEIVDNESLDIALDILFLKLKKAETVIDIYSNKGFFGKLKNSKHFEKECIEIFYNIDQSAIDINLTLSTETLKVQNQILKNQNSIKLKQDLMNTRQSLMKDKQDIMNSNQSLILNKQDVILEKIKE